jgi:hypothetical protein
MLKLYRSKEHADHFVGEDQHGALLLFPAKPRGWLKRTPYVGAKRALEEVAPALARGTKWPGAIGGKPRHASGQPSKPLTIRATDDERAAWQRAADERKTRLTAWAREMLNEASRPTRSKGKS